MKRFVSLVTAVCLILFVAGCGGEEPSPSENEQDPPEGQEEQSGQNGQKNAEEAMTQEEIKQATEERIAKLTEEPVTLQFYRYYAGLTEGEFNNYFVEPISKKFPNVTLEMIEGSPSTVLVSGVNPDIIYSSNYSLLKFKEMGFPVVLDEYFKKTHLDLDQFDPTVIDGLGKYGDDGEIYALPFSLAYGILFYNKDIFDNFGVPYPQESSTWAEIYELAKDLTRKVDGTQYRGIILPGVNRLGDQMSLPYADADKKKALVDTEGWHKIFEIAAPFYTMEGIVEDGRVPSFNTTFKSNRTTAMWSQWDVNAFGPLRAMEESGNPMNWGMTTHPALEDRPGIGRLADFHLMMVAATSEYKDLAFEIIRYIATNEDLHLEMTKNARMTALDNDEIKSQYGSNLEILKGKNVAAVLKASPAPLPVPTKYDPAIVTIINHAMIDIAINGTDINTALRNAQEQADQVIAEMQ